MSRTVCPTHGRWIEQSGAVRPCPECPPERDDGPCLVCGAYDGDHDEGCIMGTWCACGELLAERAPDQWAHADPDVPALEGCAVL